MKINGKTAHPSKFAAGQNLPAIFAAARAKYGEQAKDMGCTGYDPEARIAIMQIRGDKTRYYVEL